jgi:hypothetical protein
MEAMEAMLGISLYYYTYLKLAKTLCLFIIAYVFSSTKLEKRAEQVLPGREGVRGRGRGRGMGGEMAKTMYTHINK